MEVVEEEEMERRFSTRVRNLYQRVVAPHVAVASWSKLPVTLSRRCRGA
jgi:hypothetical protein